jgi:hypothetical protein
MMLRAAIVEKSLSNWLVIIWLWYPEGIFYGFSL